MADFMFHEQQVTRQRAAARPAGAGRARGHALPRRRPRSSTPTPLRVVPAATRGRDAAPTPVDGGEVILRGRDDPDRHRLLAGPAPRLPVRARPGPRLRRDAPARAAAALAGRRSARGSSAASTPAPSPPWGPRSGSSTAATSCCRSSTRKSPRRSRRRCDGQLGIEFLWNCKVTGCDAPERGRHHADADHGRPIRVDAVLVAAGRSSNTAALNLAGRRPRCPARGAS